MNSGDTAWRKELNRTELLIQALVRTSIPRLVFSSDELLAKRVLILVSFLSRFSLENCCNL